MELSLVLSLMLIFAIGLLIAYFSMRGPPKLKPKEDPELDWLKKRGGGAEVMGKECLDYIRAAKRETEKFRKRKVGRGR